MSQTSRKVLFCSAAIGSCSNALDFTIRRQVEYLAAWQHVYAGRDGHADCKRKDALVMCASVPCACSCEHRGDKAAILKVNPWDWASLHTAVHELLPVCLPTQAASGACCGGHLRG